MYIYVYIYSKFYIYKNSICTFYESDFIDFSRNQCGVGVNMFMYALRN